MPRLRVEGPRLAPWGMGELESEVSRGMEALDGIRCLRLWVAGGGGSGGCALQFGWGEVLKCDHSYRPSNWLKGLLLRRLRLEVLLLAVSVLLAVNDGALLLAVGAALERGVCNGVSCGLRPSATGEARALGLGIEEETVDDPVSSSGRSCSAMCLYAPAKILLSGARNHGHTRKMRACAALRSRRLGAPIDADGTSNDERTMPRGSEQTPN